MVMFRKRFFLALSFFMLFCLLAGCAQGGKKDPADEETTAPEDYFADDYTESSEQLSDRLAFAKYEYSSSKWDGSGPHSYDNQCDVTYGTDSVRSWKFSTTSSGGGRPAMQLKLTPDLGSFCLTDSVIEMDVLFDNTATSVSMRLYDDTWTALSSQWVTVKGERSTDWQKLSFDCSLFEEVLDSGMTLDTVSLIEFQFDFDKFRGAPQSVYIDNFRVIPKHTTATEESEAASDLLYGATYLDGSLEDFGFWHDEHLSTYVNGEDSKYSLRIYAYDDRTRAWATGKYQLAAPLDLRNKTLQLDILQSEQKVLGIQLLNSAQEVVTGDDFSLRNDGWQTYEVNLIGGLKPGMTVEDLGDIQYVVFSGSFESFAVGRQLIVDNLKVYENEIIDTPLRGLNGLYLGDSISEAISYKGWAGELAEHYGVNPYNVSASGAVISQIASQYVNASVDVDYDFIMLNGGVNDVWAGMNLGTVSPDGTTEFDVSTSMGALEFTFSNLKEEYPDVPIYYVLNYTCVQKGYPQENYVNIFAPMARQACEKWGIAYLDLVDNEAFTSEFDASAGVHTYDGVHPNTAGYEVLTKHVAAFLQERLFEK